MKKALPLLLFLAVGLSAVFGAESVYEIRKKAEAGDATAQFNLGLMYAKGNGVLKNSTEAAKWYRKSAEQGDAGAQVFLSGCYYLGEGVPKDIVSAHAWANNASANGNERGKIIIGMMESMLTPEQKAEAARLAREIFERIEAKKK